MVLSKSDTSENISDPRIDDILRRLSAVEDLSSSFHRVDELLEQIAALDPQGKVVKCIARAAWLQDHLDQFNRAVKEYEEVSEQTLENYRLQDAGKPTKLFGLSRDMDTSARKIEWLVKQDWGITKNLRDHPNFLTQIDKLLGIKKYQTRLYKQIIEEHTMSTKPPK
jgi:hypothetical protein